jgi:MFS family permease
VASDPPAVPDPVSDNPFSYPAYRLFWATRAFAVLGGQALAVALAWQVYEVAKKAHGGDIKVAAFWLGVLGLVQFVPMLLLSLPAGETADRRDRRLIGSICLVVDAACAAAFLALTLAGDPPLWALLALSVPFAASRAYIAPALTALVPRLIPREIMPRAISMNSLAFQLGAIAGPGLGGALIALSPATAYGTSAVLFAAAAATLLMLRANTRPDPVSGSRWALMKEGLAYVWRTRIIFGAISLDLVAVLLGGATLLLPVFAMDILHVGPQGFGWMRAAPSVGAAAMALYLSMRHIRRNAGLWMFGGVAVFGAATIVFGLSQNLWLTLLALFVIGAADMISVNVRQTMIQIVTPDHMRGRVSSVSMVFISASNELGEFESGVVARFLGPVGAAVFGGVGSLVATGLWAAWFPDLRKADRLT